MADGASTTTRNTLFLRLLIPLYIFLIILFVLLIRHRDIQLLNPAGSVARQQSVILWGALVFAAIVASCLITTTFVVALRYREGTHTAYTPRWQASGRQELLIWTAPFIGIALLSTVVWGTAHALDPYRPLTSNTPPLTVQVVALRWKWLFLYPAQKVATINQLEIPAGRPIALQLTANAPMNSFWVPRLSGQIYAMTGMVTQLHLEADHPGSYAGSPAEISGDDFAGMLFTVTAVTPTDFTSWVTQASASKPLGWNTYQALARPSSYVPPASYRLSDPQLFTTIVMQLMAPSQQQPQLHIPEMQP